MGLLKTSVCVPPGVSFVAAVRLDQLTFGHQSFLRATWLRLLCLNGTGAGAAACPQ